MIIESIMLSNYPVQYCSLQTLLSPQDIHNLASFLLWPNHFILSGATSHCPLLFPSSNLGVGGRLSYDVMYFWLFILFMVFSWKECWSGFPFLPPATMIFQNSSLWPVHLGWLCTAWLIASLSYTSPFTMTRLWFMKRKYYMHWEIIIIMLVIFALMQWS